MAVRWRCAREFDDGDVPVILRRGRDDDEVRPDEGRKEVGSTRSMTARRSVGERPEARELRRDPGEDLAGALLRNKRKEGHQ